MKYFFRNDMNCDEPYREVTLEELQNLIEEYTDGPYGVDVITLVRIENNAMYFVYTEFEC